MAVEAVPTIAAGVPPGGATGETLVKLSNSDNDVGWTSSVFGAPTIGRTFLVAGDSGDGYQYIFNIGPLNPTKLISVHQGAAYISKQNSSGTLYTTSGSNVIFTPGNGILAGTTVHFVTIG